MKSLLEDNVDYDFCSTFERIKLVYLSIGQSCTLLLALWRIAIMRRPSLELPKIPSTQSPELTESLTFIERSKSVTTISWYKHWRSSSSLLHMLQPYSVVKPEMNFMQQLTSSKASARNRIHRNGCGELSED